MAAARSVLGKQCTFTYGSLDASAQVTSVAPARSASTETVQTLASSVTIAQDREVTVTLELLFDPKESGISALLHAAWVDSGKATLSIDYGAAKATYTDVVVTELGETIPADGLVTQSVTIATGQADTIVWDATP